METLAAAVQRLTFEEKLDCALLLIEKAMTGSLGDSLTPDAVLMHPDGSVQTAGGDPEVLTFCAPEVILGKENDGREQALFMAAHLLYWMLTGETVYDHLPVDGWKAAKAFGAVSGKKMDADLLSSLQGMLSEIPSSREEGLRSFLNYLTSSVRGVLRMIPVLDGRELQPMDIDFKGQLVLHIRGNVTVGGAEYKIRREQEVQYRPGVHAVRVPVVPVQGQQPVPNHQQNKVQKHGETVMRWMDGNQAVLEIEESSARPLRRSYDAGDTNKPFVFLFAARDGDDLQVIAQQSFQRKAGSKDAKLMFHRKPGQSIVEIALKTDAEVYQKWIADFSDCTIREG